MKQLLPLVIIAILFSGLTSLKPKVPKTLKIVARALGDDFVFIPSGATTVDSSIVSLQCFFFSKGEVTNKQYRTFLNDLKAQGKLDQWRIAQVDSSRWTVDSIINPGYVDYYFRHPAYDNYPVVNISYEGAQLYCDWLTEQFAKKTGNKVYRFRLPLREEFIYAAKGTNQQRSYAWDGPYLRNSRGLIQCNFLHVDSLTTPPVADRVHGGGLISTDITAPSISFWPSEFGLYNLNGNVAEMISEKGKAVGGDWSSTGSNVQNESVKTYQSPGPTIGFRPVMTVVR